MTEAARLLDTSIFIDYLRGNETSKAWLSNFSTGELTYSVVTAAELLAGCRNRREQDLVEKELALYPMIHISGAISHAALEWYRPIPFESWRRLSRLPHRGERPSLWTYDLHVERQAFSSFARREGGKTILNRKSKVKGRGSGKILDLRPFDRLRAGFLTLHSRKFTHFGGNII